MVNVQSFTDETWNRLSGIISSAFSMSPERAGKFEKNVTARLIAAIPYFAGCREPERTALSHLATYVLADSDSARRIFDHKKEDDYDVMARLATIAGFEGGDPAVINRCMKALAVIMIEGYKRDAESDTAKGWYNPVASKSWNCDTMLQALRASVGRGGDPDLDKIIDAALVDGWWMGP